ncbi:hypothetical protein HDC92_001786 [Pedobacter sp. AK017]|uniref:hypothetical protein n=1 Tax=Pedobacter sp. AK017 TaxID=2723073 RepID=UPI0016187D1A|nr:hypothetical protein [Pedobacter sp. AK017]MBB5438111.1 hypothetical protein [Pedobacter sp. AK017]
MKNQHCLYSILILCFVSACTGNSREKIQDNVSDPVIKKTCYLAIDGSDSAFLNIESLKSGKVKGDLLFTFEYMPKNYGKIVGTMKRDTVFVDYTFKVGESTVISKNPLAFLKKEGMLILGVGVIETTLGNSYFAKDKPINFERGRFKFKIKKCEP